MINFFNVYTKAYRYSLEGDISVLKKFYEVIVKPYSIKEQIEEGEILDSIIGIKNAKIKTCKLFGEKVNIEIIKYLFPNAVFLNENNIPAFAGLNHLAFTVEDFEEAKKLIIKNGGSYTDKKSYRLIGGK